MERLKQETAHLREVAEGAGRMHDAMENIRQKATSPGGEVTVEIDVSGRLLDIALSESFRELGADGLARAILDTIKLAQAEVGKHIVGLAEDVFGVTSPVTYQLRETYQPFDMSPPPDDAWDDFPPELEN